MFKYPVYFLFLLLCGACSFGEIEQTNPGGGDDPYAINFRTDTGDDFATRAAGFYSDSPRAIKSMGVFAALTQYPWEESDPNSNFFSNLRVERTTGSDPWTYQSVRLWPASGLISFFAYAPHVDHSIFESNKPTLSQTAGKPKLSYTISATHDKQVDLLVSVPQYNLSKRDYVVLPLRHALTKISFSARLVHAPTSGTTYRVESIELNSLLNSGTLTLDGSSRQWTPQATKATYKQEIGNGGLSDKLLSTTYQSLTPLNGHLFLMPQQLADDAAVTITYSSTTNGVTVLSSKTLQLNLAIGKWNAGDSFNLMFAIDNGVTFIAVPTKWDETEVKADIKNRILNVTRIEANVYPGVATRIHFWSNQPKDSVYVRKSGNIDVAKYPTGAAYLVEDVFQSLHGASAAKLHYKGFDGASTSSGEGYIDVMMKDSSTSPYLPILKDGEMLHIWLNASGLARNIRLNSIVGSNLTTTPYIGTFHRWHETGERIVTWGYDGKWTATVIEGAGEILIDTLPSPYMATGQLFSDPYKEVGDPEMEKLASTATNPISGNGRVYFRVGWKSRLANRAAVPRYGRIRVTGNGIAMENGVLKNEIYLYIRQGEMEDYVMRPTDPNGATPNRPYAMKFSPYNLTAQNIGNGGASRFDHPQLSSQGGVFTNYPTQAGAYFAWAPDPVNGDHRRAFHPQNPASGISIPGLRLSAINGVVTWDKLLTVHETCPQGYRRPSSGLIDKAITNSPPLSLDSEIKQTLFSHYNSGDQMLLVVNYLFGYYADGFFDRRKINKKVQVSEGNATVAYAGALFYNNVTHASLFFPAAGRRSGNGTLYSDFTNIANALDGVNSVAGLYSTSGRSGSMGGNIKYLAFSYNMVGKNTDWDQREAISIRCVRDIGFSTELPGYNETVLPTALGYTADNPAINGLFISKYNGAMLTDIFSLTPGKYTIKAKVTFKGAMSIGTHRPAMDILLSADRYASGSTITYDFSNPGLTWQTGSTIMMDILDEGWDYSTNGGSTFQQGGIGRYAEITQMGKIVLKKR